MHAVREEAAENKSGAAVHDSDQIGKALAALGGAVPGLGGAALHPRPRGCSSAVLGRDERPAPNIAQL